MKSTTVRTLSLLTAALLLWGCARPAMVQSAHRSPHYPAVAEHLDLGGTFYLYLDIDGDIQRGAALIQEVLENIENSDLPEETLKRIDALRISEELGFEGIKALGMSSYRESSGMFLNRGYAHIPDGRKGLMQVFGRAPHAFDALSMAPPDAALVVEQDVNARAVMDVVLSILDRVNGPNETEKMLRDLSEPLPFFEMTPRDIVNLLDTRVIAIFKLDPENKMRVPDLKTDVPAIHAVVAVDNMGALIDPFLRQDPPLPPFRVESTGDFDSVFFNETLFSEAPYLRPVMRRHRPTNRLFIATDAAFLDDCLNGGPSIADNADFIAASRDLPIQKGNGLVYASKDFFGQLRENMSALMATDPDTRWMQRIMPLLMPASTTGEISVTVNEPEGLYWVSRSGLSHKATLFQGLYFNPMLLGAVVFVPWFTSLWTGADTLELVEKTDGASEATLNVELCYWAAVRYHEAHGTLPESVNWTPALLPSATPYPVLAEDWQHPTWRALEFAMHGPHMYQYTFLTNLNGNEFACMARGDINGNGVYSFFERRGMVTEDGYVEELGPMILTSPEE
jgi:hypothetical protein